MPILFDSLQKMDFVHRNDVTKKLPRKGVYVFYEDEKPIYVGRSKNIPNRILNHGRPSSGHNSATFAFLLAKEEAIDRGLNVDMTRASLEKNPAFKKIYLEQKKRVADMLIKAVEIESPEIEAIFEIYASRKLDTKYNDFNTH